MRRRPMIALRAALCVMPAANSIAAGYAYDVAIIDGPGCGLVGGPDFVEPGGINDLGQVVGTIRFCGKGDDEHAFFWSPETGLQVLGDLPDSAYTKGAGISNSGLTLLEWTGSSSAGGYTAAMITGIDGGTIIDLPPTPGGTNSLAFAIRDDGLVVGECGNTLVGPYPLPCVWVDGVPESLAEKFGFPLGSARAVNALGAIVGWGGPTSTGKVFPLMLEPSFLTELPNPEGSTSAKATAVNDLGDVGGSASVQVGPSDKPRGLAWKSGSVEVIPPLPENSSSAVFGISPWGAVVGRSWGGTAASAGFIWQDGVLTNIEASLVPRGSPAHVSWAVDMNAKGQILCRGSMASHPIAVVLTPIGVLKGDLNIDGTVDDRDLSLLLKAWALPPESNRTWADVDGDGQIDGVDIGLLLSDFGATA